VEVRLSYGNDDISLDISGKAPVRIVGEEFPEPLSDSFEAFERSVENPIGTKPLSQLLSESSKVSILVSDLTRSGSRRLLMILLEFLERRIKSSNNVAIFIATGMHRHLGDDELNAHLGEEVTSRWRIIQHDPTDAASLKEVGTSPKGTPYAFAQEVVDSDLIVALGGVSFHYFAGFGGARKLILPGVAGEETILSNHRLSLKEDPALGLADRCLPANLEGNPVHEDMVRGARAVPVKKFFINYITGDGGEPVFLNSGEMEKSHEEACRALKEMFSFGLKKKYRAAIISGGGYPKDINLLQAHKSLKHTSFALEDGAIVLAALSCPEGVGSESYLDSFSAGVDGVYEKVRKRYTINSQTAVSTREMIERFKIYLKSELDDSMLQRFGFRRWDPEDTDMILRGIDEEDIIVIKDASTFLPAYWQLDDR